MCNDSSHRINPKFDYAVADGPVLPGVSKSIKLEISKHGRSSLISVAGMLVTTNDAFFAVRDIWFLGKDKVIVEAPAYDAGSERNSEDCDFIPGPPCGNSPAHDPAESEGYVHIHAGPASMVSARKARIREWMPPCMTGAIRLQKSRFVESIIRVQFN
jgi:hypothetical protein